MSFALGNLVGGNLLVFRATMKHTYGKKKGKAESAV